MLLTESWTPVVHKTKQTWVFNEKALGPSSRLLMVLLEETPRARWAGCGRSFQVRPRRAKGVLFGLWAESPPAFACFLGGFGGSLKVIARTLVLR